MIDSTNPRILANNIRKLFVMVKAIVPGTVVEGNPTGTGYTNLLKKIKIGSSKYKLPDEVTANPEDAATGDLSKIKIGDTVYSLNGTHMITGHVTTTTAQSGKPTVTFETPLPTADYAIVTNLSGGGSGWAAYSWRIDEVNKSENGFEIYWYNDQTHAAADIYYFVIY